MNDEQPFLHYAPMPPSGKRPIAILLTITEALSSLVVLGIIALCIAFSPIVPRVPKALVVAMAIVLLSGMMRRRISRPQSWRRSSIFLIVTWIVIIACGVIAVYYAGGGGQYLWNLQHRPPMDDAL